ncbi:uncharacterized protein LOC129724206 isoform X2 [Wyeomyia smithii]|uniref:uncharacterized protein LOC129724206 isoform X2 n=1 Tax=Wyeomyia smithii TaxID=174621 RepID=UPI002467FA7E|nr:uncharacterized protein LOC129724206 isoform X2 [Wyeomyia smithii]
MKAMDIAMDRLKKSTPKNVVDTEDGSSEKPKVEKLTKENLNKFGELHETEDEESDNGTDDESEDGFEDQSDEVSLKSQNTKKSSITRKSERTNQCGQGQVRTGPTKTQLAARNGASKKLPTFTGKPEEWPLFFGMYRASNEACGYSDIENLVRLQECMTGQALEMVRGQLLLPKSVPKVIEKLRQLYERPEQLLQSLLEKVHKLEPLKTGKLAIFIPFGTVVEQLGEHLEAAELKQHLVNPLLIQELVDKLPDNDKREWVRFKRGKKKVTLRTFTNFLSEIVSEACEANVSMEFKPIGAACTASRAVKPKEKGAVYNHSEADNHASSVDNRNLKPCKVCQRTDHRLRYCQDFRNLSYADRMNVVDQWKLCRVCLNEHGSALCAVETSAHIRTNNVTLFRMIPVNLHCGEKSINVLAFLDEGASVTLVENCLAERLGVNGIRQKLTIKWTADIARVEKDSKRMNLWVSGVGAGEKCF